MQSKKSSMKIHIENLNDKLVNYEYENLNLPNIKRQWSYLFFFIWIKVVCHSVKQNASWSFFLEQRLSGCGNQVPRFYMSIFIFNNIFIQMKSFRTP